ncbi:MAG: proprotein convertase P-domain-containing protein, partial [Bacteroidota bacterium]
EILETTADKITQSESDPQLGNNFGSYDQNGHSQWFGYGKVNAARAVAEAVRRKSDPGEEPQNLSQSAAPNMAIPDNDSNGISDSLSFSSPALVSDVKVTVDIEHSYVGDLKVSLISPSGNEVVLQNRRGGRADNIRQTFDTANTLGLSALIGRPVQGDWLLKVQDFAPLDTGTFKSWSIEFNVKEDSSLNLSSEPGKTIPDNDRTGIEDVIQTQTAGTIQGIDVLVDITHTYIGDLTVSILSPAGTEVVLHNREGGPMNNIIKNYSGTTLSGLSGLKGESIQGSWKLKVIDNAGADVGKLNKWSLRIKPQDGVA